MRCLGAAQQPSAATVATRTITPEAPASITIPSAPQAGPDIKQWLDEIKCGDTCEALHEEGAEALEDVLELDDVDLERLLAPLKNIPRKRFLKKIEALRSGAATPALSPTPIIDGQPLPPAASNTNTEEQQRVAALLKAEVARATAESERAKAGMGAAQLAKAVAEKEADVKTAVAKAEASAKIAQTRTEAERKGREDKEARLAAEADADRAARKEANETREAAAAELEQRLAAEAAEAVVEDQQQAAAKVVEEQRMVEDAVVAKAAESQRLAKELEVADAMAKEIKEKMEAAVVQIQAGFRGMKARQVAAAARLEQNAARDDIRQTEEAAMVELETIMLKEMHTAAVAIQSAWRGQVGRRQATGDRAARATSAVRRQRERDGYISMSPAHSDTEVDVEDNQLSKANENGYISISPAHSDAEVDADADGNVSVGYGTDIGWGFGEVSSDEDDNNVPVAATNDRGTPRSQPRGAGTGTSQREAPPPPTGKADSATSSPSQSIDQGAAAKVVDQQMPRRTSAGPTTLSVEQSMPVPSKVGKKSAIESKANTRAQAAATDLVESDYDEPEADLSRGTIADTKSPKAETEADLSGGAYVADFADTKGESEQVEVQLDYTAADGSIAIRAGDILLLLNMSNADWWEVEAGDGSSGFVPTNYVQLYPVAVDFEWVEVQFDYTASDGSVAVREGDVLPLLDMTDTECVAGHPPLNTPPINNTHSNTHSNTQYTQYTHNAQQRCNANITYHCNAYATPRVLGVLRHDTAADTVECCSNKGGYLVESEV